MEPVNAPEEESALTHVAETRLADPAHARTGRYVARLNARDGHRTGPTLTLPVAAGDSIRAEVFGRYDRDQPKGNLLRTGALVAGSMVVGMPDQLTPEQVPGLATPKRRLPLIGASIGVVPQLLKKRIKLPTAYLRYELFNRDSQLVAVHTQALQRTVTDEWQPLQAGARADSAGYARVSLVNESDAAAYFDDLTVSKVAPSYI